MNVLEPSGTTNGAYLNRGLPRKVAQHRMIEANIEE